MLILKIINTSTSYICYRCKIEIGYKTSPDSTALQWLTAEQTAGGIHPYLFSQCEVKYKKI